jgi:hypothetical protein
MRSLSLPPDDLLTIPWMALSIDSMRFVSSAHAILATGLGPLPWWVYLPLDTSAFSWTYCSAPFSRAFGRQQPQG